MRSLEILPYAAPLLFAAAVAATTWLSYRRITQKYPTVTTEKLSDLQPANLKNAKRL
jgi:hypothetical protein